MTTQLTTPAKAEAYTHNSYSIAFSDTERQLRVIESIDDNYSFHVRHFCAWIRSGGHQVNFEAISEYFTELNASDYSAATIRVKRQAVLKRVRMLFKERPIQERVQLEEALKDLSTGATRAPKIASLAVGSDKTISPLEYERLLEGARSERQRMSMMFLWIAGCRISEVLGVRIQHCELQGERVRIPTVPYERI